MQRIHPTTFRTEVGVDANRLFWALFTVLRGIGILGSSHPAIPGPMPQSQAALTFAQWGTPPEGPPFPSRLLSFPSRLLSKHITLYENHSFAVYTLVLLGTTISVSLSRAPPHPPSEDQRTGFSICIGPLLGRSQAYTPARWKRFGRGLEEVFSAFSSKSCKNSSLRLLGMPMGMRSVYRPTAVRLSLEFDVQRC